MVLAAYGSALSRHNTEEQALDSLVSSLFPLGTLGLIPAAAQIARGTACACDVAAGGLRACVLCAALSATRPASGSRLS